MLLALVAIIMPIGAWAYYEPESVDITLSESGIATCYYGDLSLKIPEGISASIITGVEKKSDGTVTVTEEPVTEIIPAGCAVILRGDEGTYTFEFNYENGSSYESNLLLGSDEPTRDAEEGYLYFTLDNTQYNTSNSAYFKDWIYVGNEVNNDAHKAYLALPVDGYPELAAMLEVLENPHLQHTHSVCDICGQVTGIEAAWGTSADAETFTYGTLADAFTAAAEENSTVGYIQLQEDVETGVVIDGGTFTLDLNGHTIGASDESHGLQIQGADTHVTLKGEAEGSMVSANVESFYAVCVAEGALVTIESGTYKGSYAIHNDAGCSVTIAGGEFEYTGGNAIDNYGNLVVKGGTFTHYGEDEGDESFPTIYYWGGSIDLSNYPTDAINSIDVINASEEDITPGAETILLPEGYCFLDYEGIPVTVLVNGGTYYIGEVPAQYAITFEANDGEGNMKGDNAYEGIDYTLPECTFTAPEGKMFDAWQVGDDEENLYQPGDVITITADTEVTAVWGDIKIVINMYDSQKDGWHEAYIDVLMNGESIGTATLVEGEDGEGGEDGRATFDYDSNCTYSFIWHYGPDNFFPDEISFEISIGEEQLFTSEEGDCEEYFDGQQIYPLPTLDELAITDGTMEEFNMGKTKVDTLTYTRTLPNLMWNALYVPFEIPVSALIDNYDVAYINDIRSYDTDENGEIDEMTMELIKLSSGTLHANHPYLIRAKNEEAMDMNLVLTDATLYNTLVKSFTCSSMYMEFTITGTYNTLRDEDLEEKYAISTNGAWQKLSEGSSLKPFRLYMEMTPRDGSPVKVEAAALSRIRISVQGEDGNTTGVEILEAPQSINDAVLYDLYGRKVTTPVKGGIYISNGKKVIVK